MTFISRRGFFGLIVGAIIRRKVKTPTIHITPFSVQTRPRQLKGTWTIEPYRDLQALHGLDAEMELSSI